MSSDDEPFLPWEEDERDSVDVEEIAQGAPSQRTCGSFQGYTPLIIHFILITFYTIFSFLYVHFSLLKSAQQCPGQSSSMSGLVLSYEQTIFHNLNGSLYAGPPGSDIDAHWKALLAPMNLRVSHDELNAADQASVALPDGGYMAWLGTYHTLHCINMIRQWTYPDYYHEDMTQDEREHYSPHIDHCIELLRQNAMCRPDLSLTTFKWDAKKTEPMFNASESVHTCVDWDSFTSSVAGRVVSDEEYARLKNPLMG